MKTQASLIFAAALLAALHVLPGTAAAQESFTIAWSSLDGGGGPSAGEAEFTLGGSSVGQMSVGDPSGEPGEFDLTGGFWTFPFEPSLDLNLTMQLDGGTVTLTWDAGGASVVLESSEDMELWGPVDPQPATPFFQETEGTRRFYRLAPP
jgi:hypothetical protein